ncbi:UNVERIFIED_CONTAM: spop [Trichonephila clavipes]
MGLRRGFTYYWQIKNFSFAWKTWILSPEFFVDIMDDTVWRLVMVLRPPSFKDCIGCYLTRICDEADSVECKIDYELEYLDGDGFSLLLKEFSGITFDKNYNPARKDVLLVLKNYISLPGDTLTVICRIWKNPWILKEEGRCFAVTRIKVDKTSCVAFVENFGSLVPNIKRAVRIKSASRDTAFASVNICVSEDGKICIEVIPIYNEISKVLKCTVILLGLEGKQLECCRDEFERPEKKSENTPEPSFKFQLIHTKSELDKLFIANSFYVQCEMEYSTEIDYSKIEKTEYAINLSKDMAMSNLKSIHSASVEDERLNYLKEGRLDHLKDDLMSFYQNNILCDTKVKTRSESFSVHSLVLRARSAVFHNHFLNDYGRFIQFIQVDLDPDIVRRMLLFLYSDSLEDLDTTIARRLYLVAITYEIPSLKRKCSLYLLENLQPSNCCDTLLLADKHQDRNMKAIIQDYIHQHDEEIYSSNEWNNFIKNNSLLAAETMCLKFKKK